MGCSFYYLQQLSIHTNSHQFLIVNKYYQMRKQVGRIYCRQPSNSPHKVPTQTEKSQQEDVLTIRKQISLYQKIEVLRQSKNRLNIQTNRSKQQNYQSICSSKSHQFSSIKGSSFLSADDFQCLKQSKVYNSNTSFQQPCLEEGQVSIHNDSRFTDSLAVYENPLTKNNEIVKKLSHLNNIFKEVKNLRCEKLNKSIINQINETERELIEVERSILRNC